MEIKYRNYKDVIEQIIYVQLKNNDSGMTRDDLEMYFDNFNDGSEFFKPDNSPVIEFFYNHYCDASGIDKVAIRTHINEIEDLYIKDNNIKI